jgi:hypothetical protein
VSEELVKQRIDFNIWALARGEDVRMGRGEMADRYLCVSVQAMWESWREAISRTRKETLEEAAKLMDDTGKRIAARDLRQLAATEGRNG